MFSIPSDFCRIRAAASFCTEAEPLVIVAREKERHSLIAINELNNEYADVIDAHSERLMFKLE